MLTRTAACAEANAKKGKAAKEVIAVAAAEKGKAKASSADSAVQAGEAVVAGDEGDVDHGDVVAAAHAKMLELDSAAQDALEDFTESVEELEKVERLQATAVVDVLASRHKRSNATMDVFAYYDTRL